MHTHAQVLSNICAPAHMCVHASSSSHRTGLRIKEVWLSWFRMRVLLEKAEGTHARCRNHRPHLHSLPQSHHSRLLATRGSVEIPDLAVADTILGWALKTGGLSFHVYHNHEIVISCWGFRCSCKYFFKCYPGIIWIPWNPLEIFCGRQGGRASNFEKRLNGQESDKRIWQ